MIALHAALGNKAAEKGMSYMTEEREEGDAPYWAIIAENGGGLCSPGSCPLKLPALASYVLCLHA